MRSPLVGGLLEVSTILIEQAGGVGATRQVLLRRAISTAYYAVFHQLCFVCASRLVGWSRTAELEPIYRSVDHRVAKTVCQSLVRQGIVPGLNEAAETFLKLQELRHVADYTPPGYRLFTRDETLTWINEARVAASLIENLDDRIQRQLAIQLIARPRRS